MASLGPGELQCADIHYSALNQLRNLAFAFNHVVDTPTHCLYGYKKVRQRAVELPSVSHHNRRYHSANLQCTIIFIFTFIAIVGAKGNLTIYYYKLHDGLKGILLNVAKFLKEG